MLRQLKHRSFFVFILLYLFCGNALLAQEKNSPSLKNPVIDSLLQLLKNTHEDTVKVKALNSLAWEEFNHSRSTGENRDEVILKYANEALALSIKLKNKQQQGLAIYTTAALNRRDGKFAEALKKYLTVLKLSQEIGDKLCVVNQYSNIGDMYSILGNIPEAINYHLKAVKISEETGDKFWILNSYNRIGNIYSGAGKNEEAQNYYLLSLNIAKETDDKKAVTSSYTSLGDIYKNKDDYPEALKYYFAALEIYEKGGIECPDCGINIYLGIGWVRFCEALFNKTSTPNESYSEALNYFQKTLQLAQKIRSKWYLNEAYGGLANTYKQLNNYQKALEYTELHQQVKDSIFSKDAMDKISKVKTQYEEKKVQIERSSQEKLFIAQEKATREKLLSDQKLEQEKILSKEKIANAQALAEQKFEKDRTIAEQKAEYEKSIATEKLKQEKIRTEKQQMNNLLLMGLILVITSSVFLFFYIRQRNEKKIAVEKAEIIRKMAELEMQSLRSQLNPHFMFNSLNSIQTLILKEDPDKSQSYLSQFARLLRMLLENADKPFIPLEKEINFLELYLSLESLRIPDMQYSISADSELDKEKILIPNMFLQPYVENAIWHGLSHKENNKRLQIRILRQNGTVNYEIEDNGVGRKKAEELKSLFRKQHQSKGMELLSRRIKLLNNEYKSAIQTDIRDVIKDDEVSGTLVSVKVPAKLSYPLQN
jgi:tetratricopeptide (TPR) repeat protein